MPQNIHYHSKMQGRELSKRILGKKKTRPKISPANSILCISMSVVNILFRSPFLLGFLVWFQFWLAALLSRYCHDFVIPNIFGSPRQYRLSPSQLHVMTSVDIQWLPWHIPGLRGFILYLFSSVLNSKTRTMRPKLPSSAAWWGWKMAPFFSYVFTSFMFPFTT